jgi:two-component system chemotaxis sensor kinase CheA
MGEITNQGLPAGGIDLSQFHSVFFEEAGENLDRMEALLLSISVGQADDEDLHAVFRVAHSIKGGAATFGFADVTALTHELETLLDRLRRHELSLREAMVDVLLEAGDALRNQLASHQGGRGGDCDSTELIVRIRALAAGGGPAAPIAKGAHPPAELAVPGQTTSERELVLDIGPGASAAAVDGILELFRDLPALGSIEALDGAPSQIPGVHRFTLRTPSSDQDLLDLLSFHVARDQVLISESIFAGSMPVQVPVAVDEGFGFFDEPGPVSGSLVPAGAKERRASAPQHAACGPSGSPADRDRAQVEGRDNRSANLDSSTLRVSVERVDQLINLVGELVITQTMLAQQIKDLDPGRFHSLLNGVGELERHTHELQEAVMSIRMIPMSFVFNRFPRLIRDLSAKLGKKIELKMCGEAAELDKGLIEKIVDPLTHLVRNSADHGLEEPQARVAAGKSETGTITLSAEHQGGSILIEVRDDGQGLRRDRILAKARERGLVVGDDMSDADVWALIWEAGFSTASELSDVSGRGVGMDVVRRNISDLGGAVELDSRPGQGTRVSVRLPLTLAIIDGMSIRVGTETYIFPLESVIESLQVAPGMIQSVGASGRVVKVRNEFIPAISLADRFNLPCSDGARDAEGKILVVVESDDRRIAVAVDELVGKHQVVVKSLESNYRRVRDISGATILGDGRVVLIIDVSSLIKGVQH